MDTPRKHEKIKLVEINSYLTCYLCKGYLIDATTISECLHSFCRSCIIKFLQENCYCPVCEVIINKAKPCLKLDKTLQDIVYKLVPGLFVKEMYRRKEFYQNRPTLAPKVSPEERGEDTERTIFNPQDAISLSIEYISDDSAPGAIPSLPMQQHQKNGGGTAETTPQEPQDNPMKRYLQCPGMCRIEVLKKFVRNKYNVDTNRFHIDILYKRVPLPDHYTLIDIGYIYSWKRNEPMKFFFRITDINKLTERFDYFDGRVSPEIVQHKPTPTRIRQNGEKDKKKASSQQSVKSEVKPVKSEVTPATPKPVKSEVTRVTPKPIKSEVRPSTPKPVKNEVRPATPKPVKSEAAPATPKPVKSVSVEKEVLLKPEIKEEIKNKIQSEKSDSKNAVYTNITLNRDDNVEIITKIQKVSNKEGQPIGLNIIKNTVKKANKVQNNNNNNNSDNTNTKLVPSCNNDNNSDLKKSETKTEEVDKEKEELEKSKFLKSIELTAKSNVPINIEKKEVKPQAQPMPSTSSPSTPTPTSAQKRKNSSPMKNDKTHQEKRAKIEKKPMKIIIQPKSIPNPTVRQMVTNVNQNVNSMSKIVEQTTTPTTGKPPDIQSIIDNCKINIPSSLSITLNEGGEGGARTPPSIPPVKNYIEILKLPDSKDVVKDKNRNIPSFQKIFEESINKKSPKEQTKQTPLDLTSTNETTQNSPSPINKRKILEIASQLQKKTKIVQEKQKDDNKIAIPRLATQRTLKPPPPTSNKYEFSPPPSRPQNSASLHSSSLGLNYTVSVAQTNNSKMNGEMKSPSSGAASPKKVSPSTSKSTNKNKNNTNGAKNLSPNQLLEKYNIQNLAQLTASFNFNPASYNALQHAMLLKQMEHQNWLNQGPLLQYEKYLQTLSAQSKLMGNIKEN